MRRICFHAAISLDGYIAGPNGEFDWIIHDPEIDFVAIFSRFDTLLAGRRTFELMVKLGNTVMPGMKTIVFSKTLQQQDHPEVTIVAGKLEKAVAALRDKPGKDILLFGGAALFKSFLDANLVDQIEIGIIPVLLGEGIPLLPPPAKQAKLKLTNHKVYKSGIVMLTYDVA
jgi:dihydrofolate reductase